MLDGSKIRCELVDGHGFGVDEIGPHVCGREGRGSGERNKLITGLPLALDAGVVKSFPRD